MSLLASGPHGQVLVGEGAWGGGLLNFVNLFYVCVCVRGGAVQIRLLFFSLEREREVY